MKTNRVQKVKLNFSNARVIYTLCQSLIGLSLLSLLACNGGSSGSSNNIVETTSTSMDVSKQAQLATATVNTSCFTLSSPSTSLSTGWVSGKFYINNICSTNQSINGLSINIASNNFSLNSSKMSLNSINGLYFGPPAYWAQPSLSYAGANIGLITATVNTAGNIAGYIRPGVPALFSFGYNPEGKLPGAFSYAIQDGSSAPIVQGNIAVAVDATALSAICAAQVSCNIPIVISGQNGGFNQTVATITNSNAGTKINANISGLNIGSYSLSTGVLPQYVTATITPINITVATNTTTNAVIVFAVTKPAMGSLSYTIAKPSAFAPESNLAVMYLNGPSGNISNTSNYAATATVNNLVAGKYSITSTNGLADALHGYYYDAYINNNITVNVNKTTALGKIQLIKDSATPVSIALNVSGLENNDAITIRLTDSYKPVSNASQQFNFNTISNIKNGVTTLKLLPNDQVVFNVTVPNGYNAVSPLSYMVVAGDSINIKVNRPVQNPVAVNLLKVDFNADQLGLYTKTDFKSDWGMSPNSSAGQGSRLNIVNDGNNKVLELTYLANQVGGNSAMTFTPTIGSLSTNNYTHLYFQYQVKFANNFTWMKGGKLPGLTSYPDSPTGCIDNNIFDGFSARLMWRESGNAFSYIYNPDKLERCGDYYDFAPLVYFKTGQWYTITQEVQLNDIGLKNGYIREWVNGVQVMDLQNLLLRKGADIFINQIKMDSFFGGSSSDWAPTSNQYAYFDNFVVSETMPD